MRQQRVLPTVTNSEKKHRLPHSREQHKGHGGARRCTEGTALPTCSSSCSSASTELPADIVELIFKHLSASLEEGGGNRDAARQCKMQCFIQVAGVCRVWRRVARMTLFGNLWRAPARIQHPVQLFGLGPPAPSTSQSLMKCFVRRIVKRSGAVTYLLHYGFNHRRADGPGGNKLLLAACRGPHGGTLNVYLQADCQGRPCAQITKNLLGTVYTAVLDPGILPWAGAASDAAADMPASTAPGSLDTAVRRRHRSAAQASSSHSSSQRSGREASGSSKGSREPSFYSCFSASAADTDSDAEEPAGQVQREARPQPEQQHSRTDGGGSGTKLVPRIVARVQYLTRLKGFMKPRRIRVSLCNPGELACFDTSTGLGSAADTASGSASASSSAVCSRAGSWDPRRAAAALTGDAPAGRVAEPAAVQSSTADDTASPSRPIVDSLAGEHAASAPPSPEQKQPVALRNKTPHWNETLRCWCLNFRGRVKLASVKNFQLVQEEDGSEAVVLQFGKVEAGCFILDYMPHRLSALQAFAISLTTFETKVLL